MVEKEAHLNEVLFIGLILNLQASAMVALGKIINPVTQKADRNLNQARITIDMLAVLEEKTKGNLTDEEARTLRKVLTELRMNFVDEAKKEQEEQKAQREAKPEAKDERSDEKKAEGDKIAEEAGTAEKEPEEKVHEKKVETGKIAQEAGTDERKSEEKQEPQAQPKLEEKPAKMDAHKRPRRRRRQRHQQGEPDREREPAGRRKNKRSKSPHGGGSTETQTTKE